MTEAQHKLECEARQWISYAMKNGRAWWERRKKSLIKKRGNIEKLLSEMERQRKNETK